jgi:hypothetical protein
MCDISNNHSLKTANPHSNLHTNHWTKVNQRRSHLQKLEDDITSLAAHIDAAMFRWLELIREFDECEGWAGDGIRSCAHWLNWKCGLGLGAARERVRVANALKNLPKICEAFRQGRVSYSKVRAMTRVATTRNEDVLLDIAFHGTAWHVERAWCIGWIRRATLSLGAKR